MKSIVLLKLLFEKLVSKCKLVKPFFIIAGIVSLIWFIIRVVPKPSRAAYPCMQTAFPIASSFVIWLIGSVGSIVLFKKVPDAVRNKSYLKVAGFALSGVLLLFIAISVNNNSIVIASPFAQKAEVVSVNKAYGNTIDSLKVKVGVVKSDKALASELNYTDILSMVREAIRLSGGIGHLITDGKTVLLKPNIVSDLSNRTIEVNGATTDYRVVQAVAQIVRELNPKGRIILAEGSAGVTNTFFARLKYLDIPNIDYVIPFEAFSGGYREYTSDSLVKVDLPDSLSKYPDDLKPNKTRAIYYNKQYYNADVVISIPVLKNHGSAGITGGVKNVAIGCTPANIYADNTYSSPLQRKIIDHTLENLNKWLHDYYVGRPVDFVVMDALQGGSSGPGVGNNDLNAIKRNQHNMRLIIAGRDAVATDAVEGLIMGHDPQLAPYLVYIHNSGFGTVDPALIDVVGVKVNTVRKFMGFDNKSTVVPTPFSKFIATDYQVAGSIANQTLTMSVSNPVDLARMTVKVDNQKINKYVVGGFNNISLSLDGINVTSGIVNITFEDRYLNPLVKEFKAQILSSVLNHVSQRTISVYPNPVGEEVNIRLEDCSNGLYKFQIIDVKGRVMLSAQHANTANRMDYAMNLSELNSGNYLVRLVCPDGNVIQAKITKN